MTIKYVSTLEQQVDANETTRQQDNPEKIGNNGKTEAPATRVHKDKHELPVIYEAAHKPKKPAKAEADTISVLWHELISPLTLIKGYTATLLQLDYAITKEQKQQYLQGIDSASNRVIRLLENLRDITHLEETDALNLRSISMPDLLRQLAAEMQNQTNTHVIKIHPTARLPLVKADPEKIELIINNLLVNAIKYSPQGGDIIIETRMVETEPEIRRLFGDTPPLKVPCLITSVADTGVGITEEDSDQIFQKFYRVNNKITQTTPGAGLGLYICKVIVETHGGHIWAKNRIQNGSVFYFSLPLDRIALPKVY